MSAIAVGGDLVHYEKLGRGKAIILIHGWIGSWRYWIPLMRLLQLEYSVYAVDLFGYGDSGKNPAKYGVNHQVEMMSSFMQQLGVPKAAIVGHGLGAMIAAQFARQYPDRVARLMLVAAPLFDPGDLNDRTPPGSRILLTPTNNASNPFPNLKDVPTASSTQEAARLSDAAESKQTPEVSEATILSATQETLRNPNTLIDREQLRQAALARGSAALRGDSPSIESPNKSARNHLKETLNAGPLDLLLRCFKRSEPEFETLNTDLDKMDAAVIERSASHYEAGMMLDTLRLVQSPIVIVHGNDDKLITAPGDNIWNYLTLDKDDTLLPIPIPGVRHFPMLEYEPFSRLVGDFLKVPDISKIEIKDRWRRRSR